MGKEKKRKKPKYCTPNFFSRAIFHFIWSILVCIQDFMLLASLDIPNYLTKLCVNYSICSSILISLRNILQYFSDTQDNSGLGLTKCFKCTLIVCFNFNLTIILSIMIFHNMYSNICGMWLVETSLAHLFIKVSIIQHPVFLVVWKS